MSDEKEFYKNYPPEHPSAESQPGTESFLNAMGRSPEAGQQAENLYAATNSSPYIRPATPESASCDSPQQPAATKSENCNTYATFQSQDQPAAEHSEVNFILQQQPAQSQAPNVEHSNPYTASTERPVRPRAAMPQQEKQNGSYRVVGGGNKRFGWGKKLLMVVGSLAAVAVISLASIGAYTLIADNDGDAAPVVQEKSGQSVANQVASTGGALTISEIAHKVSPSVVSIVVQTTVNCFGMEQATRGSGTGVIMSTDGYILTNAHVVSGASAIAVTLQDGTEYEAKLIGADDQSDVGVIKIDADDLPAVEFGDSDTLEVGDDVVIIGNPLGTELTGTVSDGIVSYLNREIEVDGTTYRYIQTNAGINSGNSGGPLVNNEGLVVGINSAKVDSSMAEGIGFALPINDVLPVADDLIENGFVTGRPMIGVYGQDIDEDASAYYQVPLGAYVTEVMTGSPAEDAGLMVKDIITAVNGKEITGMAELNNEKNNYAPGDEIELTIYRLTTGEELTVSLTLAEQTN